jgi:hypothetical protein
MNASVMAHLGSAPIGAKPTAPYPIEAPVTGLTLTFGEPGDNVHIFLPLERADEVCAALVKAHAEAHALNAERDQS